MLSFDPAQSFLISLLACAVLCAIAYWKHVFSFDGTLACFFVGMVIGVFGDLRWLALLLIFLLSSFAATKYKFQMKVKLGLQEGKKGERTSKNVIANGLAPMLIAFLSWGLISAPQFLKPISSVVFLSALSVAASDTIASEMGVLSTKTYMITSLKPCKTGLDGGVSAYGQMWALVGAAFTSVIGWTFLFLSGNPLPPNSLFILIPLSIGFLGCQIDSVLGALVESRGLISKGTNNFISIAIGALIAWGLLVWFL